MTGRRTHLTFAFSYSGVTLGRFASISRMRLAWPGWVDRNCGGWLPAPIDSL